MSFHHPQSSRPKSPQQKEVDRRKFVQTIMASVPAASLACAIPAMGGHVGETPTGVRDPGSDWICAIQVLFEFGDDLAMYLMLNCSTNEFFNFIGTQNMPLGTCDDPGAGGCHQTSAFNRYPRTDDEFDWVLSPELDAKAIERVKFLATAMKSRVTR